MSTVDYRTDDSGQDGSNGRTRRSSFLDKAEDYIRSYGGLTTAIGFSIAAPIGFAAGFSGSLLSDTGKFAYESVLYLAENFPNYAAGGFFRGTFDFLYSSLSRALVTGLKDGFVAGIGGVLMSRWMKRKLLG